jgi:hypothetical protein
LINGLYNFGSFKGFLIGLGIATAIRKVNIHLPAPTHSTDNVKHAILQCSRAFHPITMCSYGTVYRYFKIPLKHDDVVILPLPESFS